MLLFIFVVPSLTALKLSTVYEWSYVNFTWPSYIEYNYAEYTKRYVQANNVPTGIKIYGDRIYVSLARRDVGAPVTLAYVSLLADKYNRKNALMVPFPSWEMNVEPNCDALQNVNGFEIDRKGSLWVVDGVRHNGLTSCPAKLVIIDSKSRRVQLRYEFPEHVTYGGFLTDIVLDDDGFAYISDGGLVDPGLIVFSRGKLRSWKVRHPTFYPQPDGLNFTNFVHSGGLYGLALSPARKGKYTRYVYYNALSSYDLYSLDAGVLRNEKLCRTDEWRRSVHHVGRKIDQGSALAMDNKGNLYFGLLNKRALARWSIYGTFQKATVVLEEDELDWIASFAFNSNGNLYILANGFRRYLSSKPSRPGIKFRIFKVNTQNRSYQYAGKRG